MSDKPEENFDENFDRFEKQRQLATAMVQFKTIYDSMIAAGFSEAQALRVISNMLLNGSSQ